MQHFMNPVNVFQLSVKFYELSELLPPSAKFIKQPSVKFYELSELLPPSAKFIKQPSVKFYELIFDLQCKMFMKPS